MATSRRPEFALIRRVRLQDRRTLLSSAMPPTCNIDAKGKLVRLIYGLLMLSAGVLVAVLWALPAGGWIAWFVVAILLASGVFGVYEARTGWCAVRAMGFRTRY